MPPLIYLIRQKHTPFGGAENYLRRLRQALEQRGITVRTLHSHAPKWLPAWLKALWFDRQICRHPHDGVYFALDRIRCPDIYRAGDGVHKVYLTTRGFSLNPLHPVYLFLEKRCFQQARYIIANSRMVKEQIIRGYDIDADKIRVIYNGVAAPKVVDKPAAWRRLAGEFDLTAEQPVILFTGNGFARKGMREFLEILARIPLPVTALVAGTDKHLPRYRRLAQRLGVTVTFAGARRDIDDFYAIADVLLLPTHYEPFSNVVLEAMRANTAVFTTAQNGAAEILPEAFVMTRPDDFSVAERITALLEDKPRLAAVRQQHEEIARSFGIEENVEQTLEVLMGLDGFR